MDLLNSILSNLQATFLGWNSRLAVIYILATVVLVFGIWWARGRPGGFVAFLLPRKVYRHRSNLLDLKIFCVNLILGAAGILGAVLLIPAVTVIVLSQLVALQPGDFQPLDVTWGRSALATVLMLVAMDFCKYWAHYLHHENRYLWPFHALHHSAEVLTPLTANRNHPVFLVVRNLIYSLIIGIVQALVLFLLMGEIDLLTIGGANAGYFVFNLLGANLRHSHVWLSYGPVMEHVFISPAQHQIHHSRAKKHHNLNYGEVLAIWDWMFGTLYVTDGEEQLDFGLADAAGNEIPQPHPTLRAALFKPFAEALEEATGIDWVTRPEAGAEAPAAPAGMEPAE
jgi:sterol desaturase/sphingolipid hydroxylase (fatty acid hydroxylase superfamily)